MSAPPSIEIRSLAADVRPPGAAGARPDVTVARLTLRLHAVLLPELNEAILKGKGFTARLEPDGIVVEGKLDLRVRGIQLPRVPIRARLVPSATPDGYLRVELAELRAVSFVPISPGLVMRFFQERLAGRPGVARVGEQIDLDLQALLRHAGVTSVTLPPRLEVRRTADWIELEYGPATGAA